MKRVVAVAAALLCGSMGGGAALGAEMAIPHTFQAGTPAVAAEVNANFEAAKQAVDDNHQRLAALFGPEAKRLVVAESGGNFSSIQAAIDAVPAGEPHVIDVRPGTYTENVVLRSNVHLRGSGREVTILQAAVVTQPTLTIDTLQNVAVTGLAITGGTPGVRVAGAAPTLDQNAMTGNVGDGILNLQGAGSIITQNAITANQGNGLHNDASSPIVFENLIAANSLNGAQNVNGSDATMLDNAFNGNDRHGVHNILSSPTIGSCLAIGNGLNGMFNDNNSDGIILDCKITENGSLGQVEADQNGIRNNAGSDPTIGSSKINANLGNGIMNHASNPTIVVSVLRLNLANGIHNLDNSDPPIVGSRIADNSNNGVLNENGSDPAIVSCGITSNEQHGVANVASSPQIQGSVIAFNTLDGINIVGTGAPLPPVVRSNSIASNLGDGIDAAGSNPVINGNTIAANALGLRLADSVAVVGQNAIADHGSEGVLLVDANSFVNQNQVARNGTGINITGTSAPQVTHNWIVANTTDVIAGGAAGTNLSFNTYDNIQLTTAAGSLNLNSQGLIVPPNSANFTGTAAP